MNTRTMAAAVTAALSLAGFSMHASACTFTDVSHAPAMSGAQAHAVAQFAAGITASQFVATANPNATAQANANAQSHPNAPIVGLWKFVFTAPDGTTTVDAGYQTWHADNTELTNSGKPAITGNFCMGVWKQRGGAYELNHWAMGWDPNGDDPMDPAGIVNIRELVDIDQTGSVMTGTFSLDLYEEDGITYVKHLVDGTVSAARINP